MRAPIHMLTRGSGQERQWTTHTLRGTKLPTLLSCGNSLRPSASVHSGQWSSDCKSDALESDPYDAKVTEKRCRAIQ